MLQKSNVLEIKCIEIQPNSMLYFNIKLICLIIVVEWIRMVFKKYFIKALTAYHIYHISKEYSRTTSHAEKPQLRQVPGLRIEFN